LKVDAKMQDHKIIIIIIIIIITAVVERRGVQRCRGVGGGEGWLVEGKQIRLYVSCECSSAVAQSKFSRQDVLHRWSRHTEGASCQIGVGSNDDHLLSDGWPQCPCRRTSVYQVAELRRRCCGPHLVGCQCHLVCDSCLTGSQCSDLSSGPSSARPPRWQTTLARTMADTLREAIISFCRSPIINKLRLFLN